MGEIADMTIEGFLDSETGEVIDGTAPGYPRTKGSYPKGKRLSSKKHRCPVCGKKLRTQQGLRDHQRDKHEGGAS